MSWTSEVEGADQLWVYRNPYTPAVTIQGMRKVGEELTHLTFTHLSSEEVRELIKELSLLADAIDGIGGNSPMLGGKDKQG